MKTIQLLKTAGSIACVAFALNATAQTAAPAPAKSAPVASKADEPKETKSEKFIRMAEPRMSAAMDKVRLLGNLSTELARDGLTFVVHPGNREDRPISEIWKKIRKPPSTGERAITAKFMSLNQGSMPYCARPATMSPPSSNGLPPLPM